MDGPFRSHDSALDQGDVLENVPFHKWKDGELRPNRGRGLVTSDGCDCEDYDRALELDRRADRVLIHVAPLRPATAFPEHRGEEIRDGKHLRYFAVAGDADVMAEHFVDLWNEQPIPAPILAPLRRLTTIADWQWRRLLIHFAVSRFHQTPEELFRSDLLKEAGLDAA